MLFLFQSIVLKSLKCLLFLKFQKPKSTNKFHIFPKFEKVNLSIYNKVLGDDYMYLKKEQITNFESINLEQVIEVSNGYHILKRAIDIFVSLLGIVMLSFVFLSLFLLIKITSKGPALYKDSRVGKDGKEIKINKFRTMYIDASNLDKYLTKQQKEIFLKERKLDDDPRITKVGKFLRKTSLDELPQLFDILKGKISLVGPRPITKKELDLNYSKKEAKLLTSAKPGLTGCWQVLGRNNLNYASGNRQRAELSYFLKRSIRYDFNLVLLTIPAVLKRDGAK